MQLIEKSLTIYRLSLIQQQKITLISVQAEAVLVESPGKTSSR